MDTEKLVDTVTRMIMERLGSASAPGSSGGTTALSGGTTALSVVTFGEVPPGVVGAGLAQRKGVSASDTDGADIIVLTQAAFRAFHGGTIPAGLTGPVALAGSPTTAGPGAVFDLTGVKVVSERAVRELTITSGAQVRVSPGAIVTALARDFVTSHGGKLTR